MKCSKEMRVLFINKLEKKTLKHWSYASCRIFLQIFSKCHRQQIGCFTILPSIFKSGRSWGLGRISDKITAVVLYNCWFLPTVDITLRLHYAMFAWLRSPVSGGRCIYTSDLQIRMSVIIRYMYNLNILLKII